MLLSLQSCCLCFDDWDREPCHHGAVHVCSPRPAPRCGGHRH